jgi:predicted unusual protein kinase regulating ubiquinone biosynthesis (AarF/ABC1/UbiB family)
VALGAAAWADTERRERIDRQARIWRLTVRRGVHWGLVKLRGARADEARRAALEEQFAIRTAEDVAQVLGGMKGAIMKAGQMLSFLTDGLPPEAQAALATLQADVPPMAPSLAAGVIRAELGAEPEAVFLEWDEVPVAAASIGQVHRAVLRDGRVVAVKVQYPGVDRAIKSDLDNAELLYGMFASLKLKNLDVKGLVDELRARMSDELDYNLEARAQQEFADLYADHPFIRVPSVVASFSTRRVLTSEWVGGQRWEDFCTTASPDARQIAAEVIYRFAQESIHRYGVFNGDPHPGNYRFHGDGSVTFLDFGLVKRWSSGEWEQLTPVLDAVLANDPVRTTGAMVEAGFLRADHGFAPEYLFEYVSTPYAPLLSPRFTYTRAGVAQALEKILDLQGRYSDLLGALNMPTSFVILDRVVWGVSGLLGRLEAENTWASIVGEYRQGLPPSTPLGRIEAEWRREQVDSAGLVGGGPVAGPAGPGQAAGGGSGGGRARHLEGEATGRAT